MPATDRLDFRAALARRPLLLDAAMGTRLIARGLDLAVDDPSLWCLDHPEVVGQIHALDVSAGSEALLTNTFGGNRAWLGRLGRGHDVPMINRRAVEIAREVAGPDRFLIGSLSPTASDSPTALLEQASLLIEAGVDALLLETHRLDQAETALRLLKENHPILVSLFGWPESVDDPARRLIDLGAVALGANCQAGMEPALKLARKLRQACEHPLLIKPSASWPGSIAETPKSFAAAVPELVVLGVGLIGGCCGSTEAHVSALRQAIDGLR